MTHDRKLVLGGAALTAARNNRQGLPVMGEIMDELEQLMIATGYLDNAPFKWVSLILRYGLENEEQPHYQPINKKHGDLPLAIELDTHELRNADRERLKRLFMIATLKSLVHAGHKYGLPTQALEARQSEILSQIV
jgi:hypothetical protein